jgi:hypothetical protein
MEWVGPTASGHGEASCTHSLHPMSLVFLAQTQGCYLVAFNLLNTRSHFIVVRTHVRQGSDRPSSGRLIVSVICDQRSPVLLQEKVHGRAEEPPQLPEDMDAG